MTFFQKLQSVLRYRFMLFQLVRRDFKVRYRGSALGVLWSVLNPVLNMIVLSVVFGQIFHAVENYRLYLFAGLTLFNFFSEATNQACTSVVGNFGMITKVYFPKFIIPTSKVLTSAINLLITTASYLVIGAFMGLKFSALLLLIPYVWICLLLFTFGIGYLLSMMYVFFRDTQHLYGVLLTIWMYATPILYPIETLPENLIPIFRWNPLYRFIDFFRNITIYAEMPEAGEFLVCALIAAGTFLLGAALFVRQQRKFIYYV